MKNKILIITSIALMFGVVFVMGSGGEGPSSGTPYETFRSVTATEDTQLAAATQQTAPSVSDDGTVSLFRRGKGIGAIQIKFLGTAAANKTLAWTLWAWKSTSDPAKYVAYGTATTGVTETGETNEFYCDTIVITDQQWYKTVGIAAGTPDAIVSGGGISELILDSCEHPFWKIVIRDITGSSPEATTAGAEIANFN